MGAYSPLDWAPPSLVDEVVTRVAQPAVDEMRRRGTPFVGVLFVGLALTARGPRVIEFNARFGDPETQVVLARLDTPLGGLLRAAATGDLGSVGALRWSGQHAVTVVLASHNYPGTPRTGDPITGLDDVADVPTAYVMHAGTARAADGTLVSAGGRVLSVVALGDSSQARERVYRAVAKIHLDGAHHRTDIALAAERDERTARDGLPGPVRQCRPEECHGRAGRDDGREHPARQFRCQRGHEGPGRGQGHCLGDRTREVGRRGVAALVGLGVSASSCADRVGEARPMPTPATPHRARPAHRGTSPTASRAGPRAPRR